MTKQVRMQLMEIAKDIFVSSVGAIPKQGLANVAESFGASGTTKNWLDIYDAILAHLEKQLDSDGD